MSEQKRKAKKVWFARNVISLYTRNPDYRMYHKKPRLYENGFYESANAQFCAEQVEAVTGFKLKPGECKRVRIRIEEVK